MQFQNKKIVIVLSMLLSLSMNACFIVKEKESEDSDIAPSINLSPRPEIKMSDDILVSPEGDLVAYIPEEWFYVNVEDGASSDILGVAVNPDYSLSLIFKELKKNSELEKAFAQEGLIGIARFSLAVHKDKTGGAVEQVGKFQELDMGIHHFVTFSFSPPTEAFPVKAAVFKSINDNYYQISIAPMDIKGKPLPPAEEIDKIFRSALASLQFQ